MIYLEMNHVRKSFGDLEVLKDISLKVEEGEVLSIIGPSGSGKSTLLRCAAMPQAVAERLQRDFGLTFAEGYGLTETAAPSHANPPERAKLQFLGLPLFGTDARVVDPVTLAELPAGEVGEIVTCGPMLFTGY